MVIILSGLYNSVLNRLPLPWSVGIRRILIWRRTETSSTMCTAPPVPLLSGGKASAEAWTALRRAIAMLLVVSNPLIDNRGITIDMELAERTRNPEIWWRAKQLVYHRCRANTLWPQGGALLSISPFNSVKMNYKPDLKESRVRSNAVWRLHPFESDRCEKFPNCQPLPTANNDLSLSHWKKRYYSFWGFLQDKSRPGTILCGHESNVAYEHCAQFCVLNPVLVVFVDRFRWIGHD